MFFTYALFYAHKPIECDTPNRLRLFCIILTKPDSLHTKAKAAYDTWATECDDHRFLTAIPTEYFNTTKQQSDGGSREVQLGNGMKLLQAAGFQIESYQNLTDKMYRSFIDISKRFGNDFDFFLKADDDTFIFMSHLRQFLMDKSQCERRVYGYNFKYWFNVKAWQSGGAGYVLTQQSMIDFGEKLMRDYQFCPNTGFEDIDVALCLWRLGTYPGRSRDMLGRERFHPLVFILIKFALKFLSIIIYNY
jgi:glycoprotein-N-acetylgalactosamine 3-beta-galactosyltransferase